MFDFFLFLLFILPITENYSCYEPDGNEVAFANYFVPDANNPCEQCICIHLNKKTHNRLCHYISCNNPGPKRSNYAVKNCCLAILNTGRVQQIQHRATSSHMSDTGENSRTFYITILVVMGVLVFISLLCYEYICKNGVSDSRDNQQNGTDVPRTGISSHTSIALELRRLNEGDCSYEPKPPPYYDSNEELNQTSTPVNEINAINSKPPPKYNQS